MRLLVDTGAWYALADRTDKHHEEAVGTWQDLISDHRLTTTNHILVETWLLLRSHLGRSAALRFWETCRASNVELACVIEEDIEAAWSIVRTFSDQDYSFTDATTFALMVRTGLTQAFSFDSDFRTFRYGSRRDRAFMVVPARSGR